MQNLLCAGGGIHWGSPPWRAGGGLRYALGVPGLEIYSRGGYALGEQGLAGSTGWAQETAGFQAWKTNTHNGAGADVTGVSGGNPLNLFIYSQLPTPNLC